MQKQVYDYIKFTNQKVLFCSFWPLLGPFLNSRVSIQSFTKNIFLSYGFPYGIYFDKKSQNKAIGCSPDIFKEFE